MTVDTGVLVHVAAPSGARDDARYRALVESCLAFEPVSRLRVYDANETEHDDIDVTVEDLTSSLASSANHSVPHRTKGDDGDSFNSGDELHGAFDLHSSMITDNVESRTSSRQPWSNKAHVPSPQQLYQSREEDSELSFRAPIPLGRQNSNDRPHSQSSKREAGDGSGTPSSKKPISSQATHAGLPEPSAWDSPLDTIPDSQPGTPRPEEELDSDRTEIDVQVERSYVPDTARKTIQFSVDNTSRDSSPDTSEIRILSSMPSPGSPSRNLPSSSNTSKTNLTSSTKPVGKRKKVGNDDHRRETTQDTSNDNVGEPVDTASYTSDHQLPKRRQILPRTTDIISLDELPLEIRAPNPKVSHEKFRTHITPTLQALADRMKLTSRFSPSHQTRPLHPLERGYWLIPHLTIKHDITGSDMLKLNSSPQQIWTQSFFSQFWCFLRDFFIEGRAGWGVWCVVEECCPSSSCPSRRDHQTTDSINPLETNIGQSSAKSVNLKVYTWGEVAPHIYMLLFLATERRIRKLQGVEWRDAKDVTVIKM